MRLLVFSDIHGNALALDAFLNKIESERYDYAVFCGDIFGYYYDQKYIIKQLCAMERLVWIKGNHDAYFCKLYRGLEDEYTLTQKYGHSYENIKQRFAEDEYRLISSKKSSFFFETDNFQIGIFHGTPNNPLEGRLYPKDLLNDNSFFQYDIVILGHTHFRQFRKQGSTMIVNPGSLGQPRDGNGFSYCLIDTERQSVEFKNVEIDISKLYQQIEKYDPYLIKLREVLERRREDIR